MRIESQREVNNERRRRGRPGLPGKIRGGDSMILLIRKEHLRFDKTDSSRDWSDGTTPLAPSLSPRRFLYCFRRRFRHRCRRRCRRRCHLAVTVPPIRIAILAASRVNRASRRVSNGVGRVGIVLIFSYIPNGLSRGES